MKRNTKAVFENNFSNSLIIHEERDCKTVVFVRFRKVRSAVSVILACEARESQTPVFFSVSPHSPLPFLDSLQTFRSNIDRRSRSQKIRLFCSLMKRNQRKLLFEGGLKALSACLIYYNNYVRLTFLSF